jgi:hypothetical protein
MPQMKNIVDQLRRAMPDSEESVHAIFNGAEVSQSIVNRLLSNQ